MKDSAIILFNKGKLTISSSQLMSNWNLDLINDKGEKVFSQKLINDVFYKVALNLLPGKYKIKIKTPDNEIVKTIQC